MSKQIIISSKFPPYQIRMSQEFSKRARLFISSHLKLYLADKESNTPLKVISYHQYSQLVAPQHIEIEMKVFKEDR